MVWPWFFALCGTLAGLFKHALGKADSLEFNAIEILKSRSEIAHWSIAALTGLFSALFALVMPLQIGIYAAFAYSTLSITMSWVAIYFGKKIEKTIQEG